MSVGAVELKYAGFIDMCCSYSLCSLQIISDTQNSSTQNFVPLLPILSEGTSINKILDHRLSMNEVDLLLAKCFLSGHMIERTPEAITAPATKAPQDPSIALNGLHVFSSQACLAGGTFSHSR